MAKSSPQKQSPGFLEEWVKTIKLSFNLLGDKRVPWYLKVLFFLGVLWIVFPDLIPGPLDDLGVGALGPYLFVELAPHEVVKEHREKLG